MSVSCHLVITVKRRRRQVIVIISRENLGIAKGIRQCVFATNVWMKTDMTRGHGVAPQSKEEHVSEIVLKVSMLIN